MKITTHIRNLIFLWRENRKETALDLKIDVSELIGRVKHNYKRKNSWVRNQVALLIRKIHKEKPYKVIDYSKAKQLFESIEPLDTSLLSKHSYITRVRTEYPVKGNRWCHYFINYSYGELDTYKMREDFEMENYLGNPFNFLPEYTRAFRFATKEEIRDFKNRQKEYKQKKEEIESLQKQITKLYKEI